MNYQVQPLWLFQLLQESMGGWGKPSLSQHACDSGWACRTDCCLSWDAAGPRLESVGWQPYGTMSRSTFVTVASPYHTFVLPSYLLIESPADTKQRYMQ